MSPIDKLKDDLSNLPDILDDYETALEKASSDLNLEGKTLEEANKTQAFDIAWYSEKYAEVKSLSKYLEQNVERVKSNLWRSYTEVMSVELSTRDKEQYIKSEEAFLLANTLLLTVREVEMKYEMVVEAFRQRGFALRNITNARVSAVQDAVI